MNLGYKQHFPFNGQWTNFEHKILAGFPSKYQMAYAKALCANLPEKQRVAYIHLFMENMDVDPKLHSIREDLHDRWKPGMKIHHSFGVRTKSYRCFAINECISTQRIEIEYLKERLIYSFPMLKTDSPSTGSQEIKYFRVQIDGRYVSYDTIKTISKNDGFDDLYHFLLWFNKPFKGKIIHWTNLKY